MKKYNIKLPNGCYLEKDNGDDNFFYFYYMPGILANRIDIRNLENIVEPQRTWIKEAAKKLEERK